MKTYSYQFDAVWRNSVFSDIPYFMTSIKKIFLMLLFSTCAWSGNPIELEFDFDQEPELAAQLKSDIDRCKADHDPSSCFRKKIFQARREFQKEIRLFPRTLHPALRSALADYSEHRCQIRAEVPLWTHALYCYWEALAGALQRGHSFSEARESQSVFYEIVGGFCESKLGTSSGDLQACWEKNYSVLERQMERGLRSLTTAYTELRKYSVLLKASGLKLDLPVLVTQSLNEVDYQPAEKFSWIFREPKKLQKKPRSESTPKEISTGEEPTPTRSSVPEPPKKSIVVTGTDGWKNNFWTNGNGRGLLGEGAGHGGAGNGSGGAEAREGEDGGDEEGGKGILSSRKVRFFDFFQRVKAKVEGEWNPNQVWRQHHQDRTESMKDYLTILKVVLDRDGNLKSLVVKKSSGLSILDDEALRSFRAASPIPNPPTGIIDENGEVRFQFGFLFEFSSGTSKLRGWR